MRSTSSPALLILASALGLAPAAPCSAQSLTIVTGATLTGVSDRGDRCSGTQRQAARWSQSSGFDVFGSEGGFRPFNIGEAISGNGLVVAGIEMDGSHPDVAYRWSGPGTHETLGRLSSYELIRVHDTDRTGSVIVGHSEGNLGQIAQAWVWTERRGLRGIGQTRPGGARSTARGVSSDGNVVVGVGAAGQVEDAFAWTQERGMQILPPSAGATGGEANAANADGSVIVGSSGISTTACVWRNGQVQLLARPSDYLFSYATSVSDDGSIIVGLGDTGPGGPRAFVWRGDGQPRPLADYLADYGITLPEGVNLRGHLETLRVSGDGRTFIGEVSTGGYFVATIPSPHTTFALLGVLAIRRRR